MSQHSQKKVQSWPQRYRNIVWELELCSSSHQVAFRLPPAARRPCDFLLPTVLVTQNAFLSTSGTQVTTNRPPGLQLLPTLLTLGPSWFVFFLCVFFCMPIPHKPSYWLSFLSFLLKPNRRSIWLDGVNCCCPFWAMHFGLSCLMGSWSTCWLANRAS